MFTSHVITCQHYYFEFAGSLPVVRKGCGAQSNSSKQNNKVKNCKFKQEAMELFCHSQMSEKGLSRLLKISKVRGLKN